MTMKKQIILLLTLAAGLNVGAEIKMPAIFDSNMVLQREASVPLRGTATPGAKVTVKTGWDKKSYTTRASQSGAWTLSIATSKAGGPYTLTVSDGKPLVLSNIMLGDVWVCSGQSNMEMPMAGFKNQPVAGANMAVLNSENPNLRLLTVNRNSSTEAVDDIKGKWAQASPESVRGFSATAYFFGRQVQDVVKVPVGLIVAAWGGSACEAWMDDEMLAAFPEAAANIPAKGGEIKSKNRTPSVLYKGMLNPLIGLPMKGVIWYQGEDNYNRAHSYADMFSTLINGWRTRWGIGEFPFYYCQIAPYDYSIITPKGTGVINSAYLREQQAMVEDRVPNVGMAVLMDAGWKEGIHPSDKRTPGERLALLALGKTYGVKGITCESPRYKSMEVKGDTVIVTFDRAPDWIAGKNSFESQGFKLAGADRVFHPAKAWISRSKVMVKSDSVPAPVAVRYLFENYGDADLFNTDGLPVSSFRSDNWPDPRPVKE